VGLYLPHLRFGLVGGAGSGIILESFGNADETQRHGVRALLDREQGGTA
jgi:hypothetical protein